MSTPSKDLSTGTDEREVTWTHRNVFDPKTIKKTAHISFWEHVRLLFHRYFYSLDTADGVATVTAYKVMKGKIYVLGVGHYSK